MHCTYSDTQFFFYEYICYLQNATWASLFIIASIFLMMRILTFNVTPYYLLSHEIINMYLPRSMFVDLTYLHRA